MTSTLVRAGDCGCPGSSWWCKRCLSTISPQLPSALPRPLVPWPAVRPLSPLLSPLPQHQWVQDPPVPSVSCAHSCHPGDKAFRDTAFRDTPHPRVHPVCRRLHHAGRAGDVRGRACVDLGCWGVFLAPVSLPESAIQPCTAPVAETGTTMTHCQEIARNPELPEHFLCPAEHPLAVTLAGIAPKA